MRVTILFNLSEELMNATANLLSVCRQVRSVPGTSITNTLGIIMISFKELDRPLQIALFYILISPGAVIFEGGWFDHIYTPIVVRHVYVSHS